MCKTEKLFCVADGTTPKIDGDGCSYTLESRDYKSPQVVVRGGQRMMDIYAIEGNGARPSHKGDGYTEEDVSYTLNAVEHHAVAYRKTGHPQSTEKRTPTMVLEHHGQDGRIGIRKDNVFGTMQTNGGENHEPMVIDDMVARRLTPLECERLQGFPDYWTHIGDWVDTKGKVHKDSDGPKYKALGNSIALPFWEWMMQRIKQYDPECNTMASLFDGIGGFPLVCKRSGIEPIWASEIEEFPIAVTKVRFPEKEGEEE